MRRLMFLLTFLLFYPSQAQETPFAHLQPITKGNVQNLQLLYTFPIGNDYYRLDWSDDGSILILNNQIYRLDETGLEYSQTIEVNLAPNDIAFHPNGHWLLYVMSNFDVESLGLYDMDSQELIRTFTGISRGLGTGPVPALGVAISPDGHYAASRHRYYHASTPFDLTIRLWDMASGEEIGIIGMEANWLGFSPDNRYLIADAEGAIRLWEIERLLGYTRDEYFRLEDLILNGTAPIEWLNTTQFYYHFEGQRYLWDMQTEQRLLSPEPSDIRSVSFYNQSISATQYGIQDSQTGEFLWRFDSFDAGMNNLIRQVEMNSQKTLFMSFEYAPEPVNSSLDERGMLIKFYGIP